MITIAPSSISKEISNNIDRHYSEANLDNYNNGHVAVWYSSRYHVIYLQDGCLIYHSLMGGISEDDVLDAHTKDEIRELFVKLEGYYTYVYVCNNKYESGISLYRGEDLHKCQHLGEIVFSSEINFLTTLLGNELTVNVEFCTNFVLGTNKFSNDTPFCEISTLMLGESVIVRDGRVEYSIYNHPKLKSSADLFPIMRNFLSKLLEGKKDITLYYSGGLDSSCLLYLMHSQGIHFKAVHVASPESAFESEELLASSTAGKLGIEMTTIKTTDYKPGTVLLVPPLVNPVNSPFDVAFSGPVIKRTEHLPEKMSEDTYIRGHGGDQVFIQNPQPAICIDTLREKGIIEACKVALRLSHLKNKPLLYIFRIAQRSFVNGGRGSLIVHRTRPRWLREKKFNGTNHHFLLEKNMRSPGKKEHVHSILTALSSCPRQDDTAPVDVSPILTQSIISYAINLPQSAFFDAYFERTPLRRALFEASELDVAWRRTKRSSSGSIFRLFAENANRIIEIIKEGVATRFIDIDTDEIIYSIRQSSTVRLGDDLPYIINLLKLDAFLSYYLKSKIQN